MYRQFDWISIQLSMPVFPETEIQNCMIHQLRNSSKYVSYKDLKALMSDLKAVYAAVDEQAALDALDDFCAELGQEISRKSHSRGGKTGPTSAPTSNILRRSAV